MTYLKTMAFPMGANEIPASFKCWRAKGIPMMVIPNMQRNDQFYVSSIEEDLLTAEFQVDPNVVK